MIAAGVGERRQEGGRRVSKPGRWRKRERERERSFRFIELKLHLQCSDRPSGRQSHTRSYLF